MTITFAGVPSSHQAQRCSTRTLHPPTRLLMNESWQELREKKSKAECEEVSVKLSGKNTIRKRFHEVVQSWVHLRPDLIHSLLQKSIKYSSFSFFGQYSNGSVKAAPRCLQARWGNCSARNEEQSKQNGQRKRGKAKQRHDLRQRLF